MMVGEGVIMGCNRGLVAVCKGEKLNCFYIICVNEDTYIATEELQTCSKNTE